MVIGITGDQEKEKLREFFSNNYSFKFIDVDEIFSDTFRLVLFEKLSDCSDISFVEEVLNLADRNDRIKIHRNSREDKVKTGEIHMMELIKIRRFHTGQVIAEGFFKAVFE